MGFPIITAVNYRAKKCLGRKRKKTDAVITANPVFPSKLKQTAAAQFERHGLYGCAVFTTAKPLK